RGLSQLSGWLLNDYEAALDEEGKNLLPLMVQRTQRMHALIDGILHYARVGRTSETEQPVDLKKLLPEIIESLASPEHVQIIVEATLPTVIGDRTRLTQVFQNLLSNALKFMDKPVGKIHVACTDQGDQWQFSIADNGPGIEEKYFEQIFQPFQALAHRDDVESTGLGLAVAKRIIETWGGRIWPVSTVGEGSTFYFTLPKKASGL
ncbi:MAG: ATP-binding protein, partial [Anaerolineae bacterium]|nr:ATP-binding protein [Anaerolineae bacterium]